MQKLNRMRLSWFVLPAMICWQTAAFGQAPMTVGEHIQLRIDSSDLTGSDTEGINDSSRVFEIHHADATYIAIHFETFDLAPGDVVHISDPWGGQRYTLEGRGKMNAETFWSQHIKGDTAIVELVSQGPKVGHGFVIDEYVAGFIDFNGGPQEAICGQDDKDNAICYQSSHPVEYDRSRAVARLLIQGSSLCTGWLASSSNHLVTNEHCISSSTAALNTDYEFDAEASNCSDGNCQLCHTGQIFSGASFIQDNAALDYALVQINSGDPAATYGFLQIDDRAAVVGEQIYIPQHPGGRAKELGITSSDSADGDGLCHVNTFSPGCTSSSYSDVGYACDTEGGSSGSPVLATSSHKVIALHHCANCPNRGVPIDLVCAEICGFLGPECTTNGDCDDGNSCTNDSCVSESCIHDPVADCCGNGTCESGEDCDSCSSDCFAGSGSSCGNGICEIADGENCQNCSADCNSRTTGPPSSRYCCGTDANCNNANCTGSGNTCSDTNAVGSCCGDAICEGEEDETNCAVDCAPTSCSSSADCNDGDDCTDDICSGGVCSNPPVDCDDGDACTADDCTGGACSSSPIICDDGDACTTDSCDSGSGCIYTEPPCQDGDSCCPSACDNSNDSDCSDCADRNQPCSSDSDCCSNKCKGNGLCR